MPMTALHKLKAYFGMVPAEEVDDYEVDYEDYSSEAEDYDAPADRIGGRRRLSGARGGYSSEDAEQEDEGHDDQSASRSRRSRSMDSLVRGSLAVEPQREHVSRLRPVADSGNHDNLSKITTLHPRSYSEARTVGEQYRDGTPVIMNLTEMDEADAKRLVDFAAGLAFAMRGSIEKVTNRVFLLSPPNVDVAAEDKRRLAEGAFFNYG
ncbi:cell division inhibitor SepF [Saccharopolyspora lacisalsi]|uniref:Cell division protein SepF n=2 Tax=Halosaccharopolyspora lacisalsi TaxID=1000566 RepID=A0A839DVU5_9PSEU|nr:cell division inhibitor SepF [Halosaccharopolyspora lacisalsi]